MAWQNNNKRRNDVNDDSDSDSSDSEHYSKLKEAVVEVAVGNLQAEKLPVAALTKLKNMEEPASVPPSLRNRSEETEADQNELNTTPEFRAHVAKKLSQILDRSVDVVKTECESLQKTSEKQGPSSSRETGSPGVKLFANSLTTIGVGYDAVVPFPQRKLQKRHLSSSESDTDEELGRFAAAAVSGEDILKQAKEVTPQGPSAVSHLTELPVTGNIEIKCAEKCSSKLGSKSVTKRNLDCDANGDTPIEKKKKKKKHKTDFVLDASEKGSENTGGQHIPGECKEDTVGRPHVIEGGVLDDSVKHGKKAKKNDSGVSEPRFMPTTTEDKIHKHGAKKKKKGHKKLDIGMTEGGKDGGTESSVCHTYKKKKCKHKHSEKV